MSVKQTIQGPGRPFRLFMVLDKMIFADLLRTVGAILLVLVIIIVSQKFIKMLAQAIEGNLANQTVFILLGLKTIIVTSSFLPAAVFMAVLIVLGRMYRDQEIAAISSAGGGFFTIFRGIWLLLLPLTACSGWLSLYASPWAEAATQKLTQQDRQSADVRGISAGRFTEYSNGDLIFYTEKVGADGRMEKIFMQNKQAGKIGIVLADFAEFKTVNNALYLVLEQGERWLGAAGQQNFSQEKFQEYGLLIENSLPEVRLNIQAIPTETLLNSHDLKEIGELQNRLNAPLGVLLLGFLAAPLAKASPRGGIYGSVFIAFGIYFIYGNLQRLNFSWVSNASIPAWLGYVWLDGLLLLLGLILLIQSHGWRWLPIYLKSRTAKS